MPYNPYWFAQEKNMHRVLKVLAVSGVVLAAACGDSSRISAELQNDLALASAGADLELASRTTEQTRIVGAVERTTPPSRAIATSARAPRPRRSPTPRITAAVLEESEIVEEPEVAAAEAQAPAPIPVEEAPLEIAEAPRSGPSEPASSGARGSRTRGTDWGTIIGISGGRVVIRGGEVGEDRCIPPAARRGGTSISIERMPQGRGTGRVVMGGRTGGRQVIHTAPARPRDISGSRPIGSSPTRPMPSGSGSGNAGSPGQGQAPATGDVQ
ncbi:MAG: hypothetical protein M3403_02825 [Gemmatimonadota bacterium]|nr:hypothetical protein [Gemmatimonadota bacterium]